MHCCCSSLKVAIVLSLTGGGEPAHVHGGALLGFMDIALFAAARGLGVITAGGAVTLDLTSQFIGGGTIGQPLYADIELLRETGRMLFLRGLIVQDDTPTIASFTGTLRKSTPPAGLR